MKITAVIPIRKGSQRVLDKNLRPFFNTTLLELKINNLLKVHQIDEIVVNTDSEEAIAIAKTMGVSYHRRLDYYASSQCSGSEFFEHLGQVTDTDIFIYCPVTSPFVTATTIINCIEKFKKLKTNDSLATVSNVKEFLWLNEKAVNYDPHNAPNSQNLPEIVALNFAVSIITKENLINYKNIIGQKPSFIVIDEIEGIDIDTPLDFNIAEQIYIRTVIEGKSILDY